MRPSGLLQRVGSLPAAGGTAAAEQCAWMGGYTSHHPAAAHSHPLLPAPLPLLSPGLATQRRPRYAAVVRAQAASLAVSPGRWLGPQTAAPPAAAEEEQQGPPVYGCELTAEQRDPLNLSQTMLKVRTLGATGQRHQQPPHVLHVVRLSPGACRTRPHRPVRIVNWCAG